MTAIIGVRTVAVTDQNRAVDFYVGILDKRPRDRLKATRRRRPRRWSGVSLTAGPSQGCS
ncbi:hypothetical protein ACFOY2_30260 [Nonomuraea purpurea]|uniref:Glyoxalase/fosfomycin resistance/dioxygenase domain-containing protein n=1 Tax=Nonomuraea purpurea TaxID=1849276 RepID=A0ABV8GCP8_9ACTN